MSTNNKKVSPYSTQMEALLKSQSLIDQEIKRSSERTADKQHQGQMLSTLGNFMNVASTPVATASEIMAKQKPVHPGLGQAWKETGQGMQDNAVGDYKNLLSKYALQNDMTKTLAQLGSIEQNDQLRNLQIQKLQDEIKEGKKSFSKSKKGQEIILQNQLAKGLKQPKPSKGLQKRDTEFAKEWTSFNEGGGYAVIDSNLSKLEHARDLLRSETKKRQSFFDIGVSGKVIGSLPEKAVPLFSEKAADIQESIAEVAQGNLRQVLGGQFAQKEGEQLIRRAYNPKLSEATNLKRLDRLIEQIKKTAGAKVAAGRYLVDNNDTLKGYKGPAYKAKLDTNNFYVGLEKDKDDGNDGNFVMKDAVASEPQQNDSQFQQNRVETYNGVKYRFLGGDDTLQENWEVIKD